MKKKILINAAFTEEKRVAIVEGDTLVDFYVEASGKEHLKGNIYKCVVARVEPGLQAAFVDFGLKKHGFLQLREIKPEYYKHKVEGKRVRIQDVIVKGQELIAQVEKDERDTKGASLTTYLSLPGRYIVMMPGEERVGVSRKIEDKEDRDRLKETFSSLKLPKDMGFILRTACSDKTGEELENDLKYLTKLWSKIQTESKKVSAPALIYKEHDIAVRTIRDYLTSDVGEVLIDDQEAYKKTKEFLKKTVPWRKINIKLYKDKRPIFSRHNLEDQIAKIHERYVYLPSRGYLVIDKTEALTAVDVNSGRSRKEENVEATALKTNLEAADEIARQFRLRDIGGLIVIDFIDMASSRNRRQVESTLREALSSDKAHTEISGISKFGMVEMTRERMRTAFIESLSKKCEVCGGTGIVRTDEMVAVSAFRDIYGRVSKGGLKSLTCRLPVESANYLINTRKDELVSIEKEFDINVRIIADRQIWGRHDITVEGQEPKQEAVPEQKQEVRQETKPEPKHKSRRRRSRHGERQEKITEPSPEPGGEPEAERPLEAEPERLHEHEPLHEPEPPGEPGPQPGEAAAKAAPESAHKTRRKQGWRPRRRPKRKQESAAGPAAEPASSSGEKVSGGSDE